MFHIEYYCPRQAPYWQVLQQGFLIFRSPQRFGDFGSARRACDGLLWQYHSARVVNDQTGQVVYQQGDQA
jgi:hypothetical protein